MALTLEQYATYLDTRGLPWPAAPEIDRPKARPHLASLPNVRAVLWNVYGTLLAVPGGDLYFEHPQAFVMNLALDKTLQEFKMWGSMSRKPGQPADYLLLIYNQVLLEQRGALPAGVEKHPEVLSEKVWEAIVKKLLQKDYKWDVGFYGALNELSRKIAYFFHSSLQTPVAYPGAAAALKQLHDQKIAQGLLADGQTFTSTQLQRCLVQQDPDTKLDEWLPPDLRTLSCDVRGRKPSERLFKPALQALGQRGITPEEVLHVGSRIVQDIAPAKRLGMRTALFAGDRASLTATHEQMKGAATRPDVLLTELEQITQVVG